MLPLLALVGRAASVARSMAGGLGRLGRSAARGVDRFDDFGGGRATGGISLRVTTNIPDVIKQLNSLRSDLLRQAQVSAVNKTIAQAKTQMSRGIRNEFNMRASAVSEQLKVNKARLQLKGGSMGVEASLEVPQRGRRSVNLIRFDAKQTPKGVSFRVKKGGGRKTIPGAFIANGGRTVFIRSGKSRLPIKALQTIDVAQMFNTRRINKSVINFIEAKYAEVFENEARFFVSRFNSGRTR